MYNLQSHISKDEGKNHEIRFIVLGCEEIEVSSTKETQQCRTGIYKMQEKITLNDKATFKHETEEQYLYYMPKGKGVWMVNEP